MYIKSPSNVLGSLKNVAKSLSTQMVIQISSFSFKDVVILVYNNYQEIFEEKKKLKMIKYNKC